MKHALLPNVAHEASVVSLRHRYVLIINSKTAGTTLKTIAAKVENEWLAARNGRLDDDPAQRTENWFWTPTLDDLNDNWLREVYLGSSFFRFTTVRHPITRCWSAWVDKIVRRHPEFVANFGSNDWFPRELSDPSELVDSFERFVDALCHRPGLLGANRHWAPQHLVLQLGAFPYDFIGKTENFRNVIEEWEHATGLPILCHAEKTGRRNTNSLRLPAELLSDSTWERLIQLYEVDFKTFGYVVNRHEWSVEMGDWMQIANRVIRNPQILGRSEASATWQRLRLRTAKGCRRFVARSHKVMDHPRSENPQSHWS